MFNFVVISELYTHIHTPIHTNTHTNVHIPIPRNAQLISNQINGSLYKFNSLLSYKWLLNYKRSINLEIE